MKKVLILLAILLITTGFLTIHIHHTLTRPVIPEDGEPITFYIAQGEGCFQIVDHLKDEGLIEHPIYLYVVFCMTDTAKTIKAGHFIATPGMTTTELFDGFKHPEPPGDILVTLPEGSNIWQMAERLHTLGICDRELFLAVVTDPVYTTSLKIPGTSLEGFLFPDTYRFKLNSKPRDVVAVLVNRHQRVWKELISNKASKKDFLSSYELVILASMIEEEARVASERKIISRVFRNRLEINMKLQSDPTCRYAKNLYTQKPTRKMCRDPQNIYSTYVIPGLPPGPISSPGKASLEAAISPSTNPAHSEYIYFVAAKDHSGRHIFSKTLKEHNRAVHSP